ncbi:BlaI/MecI/CopY family transcriptional regulator [Streptomyces sp. NPDC046557]|uniref:BlaI/MecI/CopY family transcriptional regulator n=1 Tax=Streptomyces sp. NPDC046557 TaxID=3155372 RepID=UPI00340E4FFA
MVRSPADRKPAGELEACVLTALWAVQGPQTVRQVRQNLAGELARTTVTTVLSRLFEKGSVTRERSGRGFAYRPADDVHGLTARRMCLELDKGGDRETVLARFVSELSTRDERVLRDLLDAGGPAVARDPGRH